MNNCLEMDEIGYKVHGTMDNNYNRGRSYDAPPDQDQPKSWKEVGYEFSQSTTFHGVNKITEATPFVLRRVLWVLIVMGGIVLFVHQMVGSVTQYLSRPVTVNIRINYNNSVRFPAVTICNQNIFRTTRAAQRGLYFLLDDIYSGNVNKTVDVTAFHNLTFYNLHRLLVHDKHDMIVGCSWDSNPCFPEDFVTTLTDHGVCYTFNSGQGTNGSVHIATQTGSDHGLSVRLNVEQYEYMTGPNTGAGIKVLVHDQGDVPLVHQMGLAIPPGSHAFVGIQMIQVNNLKPPYGKCSDDEILQYFDTYTHPACLINCREQVLVKQCGCRLGYMPSLKGLRDYPPVCNLEQYLNCVPVALKYFNENEDQLCKCPVPCTRIMYETVASYAETSKFDTDKILLSEDTRRLSERFQEARETTQRVDMNIVQGDRAMVAGLGEAAERAQRTFTAVLQLISDAIAALQEAQFDVDQRSEFHTRYGLALVKRAFMYGFSQEFEIQEENFDSLVSQTKDFLRTYNTTLNKLMNTPAEKEVFREVLEWQLEQQLTERNSLLEACKSGFSHIHEGILAGVPLLDFDISFDPSYDQYYIPHDLLHIRSEYQHILYGFIMKQLNGITDETSILQTLTNEAISKKPFNGSIYENMVKNIKKYVSDFDHGQRLFKREIVFKVESLIDHKIGNFNKASDVLNKESTDLWVTLDKSKELVQAAIENWSTIKEFINGSQKYINTHDQNKTDLANLASSEAIQESLQRLRNFFIDMRSRARNLNHDWRKFSGAYTSVWSKIKQEESTRKIYDKLHTDFLTILTKSDSPEAQALWGIMKTSFKTKGLQRNRDAEMWYRYTNADVPEVDIPRPMEQLTDLFVHFDKESALALSIEDSDRHFFENLDKWALSLKEFLDGSRIDVNFYRENFLKVDIYMKEMYYEEIEQQEAYDLINLWSDIGGSMGLFVGASVITVFELFDAVVHNICKLQLDLKRRRKKIRR